MKLIKKDKDIKNNDVIESIKDVYHKNKGRYSVRRVLAALLELGQKINHKKVQRLMKKLGLKD